MNVAFIGHSEDWAGAETSLVSLLSGLDPVAHAPLVTLPAEGAFADRLHALGVPTAYVATVPWLDQRGAGIVDRFATDLAWRVDALCARLEAADSHVVMSNSAVVLEGALAAKKLGLPHIWRIHEMPSRHDNFEHALPLSLYPAWVSGLSDRVAVVSRAAGRELADVPDAVRVVVPNGVSPATQRGATERPERPTVVFCGTLSEAKGAPLLAPVIEAVRRSVPEVRCEVVGRDVGAGGPLRREIQRRGLGAHFRFTGFVEDARARIARADVLLHPSRVDSLPCVVMEAMAEGVAVVATRSGGAEELVLDGSSGFLTEVDDVEAMAESLVLLLTSEARRRQMGDAGQRRACSEYSLSTMVSRMTSLFDGLGPRSPVDATPLVDAFCAAAGPTATPASHEALRTLLAR
ncbi:MAG: glycosyltransferase family 4 protein [Sandaracinaceae bacterium]